MFDLSIFILAIIERYIQSGSSIISLLILEKPKEDIFKIIIKDESPGLPIVKEESPFKQYQNGRGHKFDLGFLSSQAEEYGVGIAMGRSKTGRLSFTIAIQLRRIFSDVPEKFAMMISSVMCTNPNLDLRLRFCVGNYMSTVKVKDVVEHLPIDVHCGLAVARHLQERIKCEFMSLHSRFKSSSFVGMKY